MANNVTVESVRSIPKTVEVIGVPVGTTGAVPRQVGLSRAALTTHGFEGKVGQTLVEALEEGRVAPGSLLLMPAFGAGLTLCAHLLRWGSRVTPISTTTVDLPPCTESALEMVNAIRARKADAEQRSGAALMAPVLAETLGVVGGG